MLRAAWRVCENEILASTVRRVYIVTSSLSYAQLDQTLAGLRAGETPEPHFVQLYQLLMSCFSACTEVGAYASVVCQE